MVKFGRQSDLYKGTLEEPGEEEEAGLPFFYHALPMQEGRQGHGYPCNTPVHHHTKEKSWMPAKSASQTGDERKQ